MYTVLGFSGGKDSAATLLLAWLTGFPIDEVLCSEIIFDKETGMTAEDPNHMAFIKEKCKPFIEGLGYKFTILHGDKDFFDVFNHRIEKPRKYMDHKGKRYGFMLSGRGRCALKRDCKTNPLDKYYKQLRKEHGEIRKLVGIAADETPRLKSLHKDPEKYSLLEQLGYTEAMCYELCKQFDMLSPNYTLSRRGGCFCCPYSKDAEKCEIKKRYPEEWAKYVACEDNTDDVANTKWSIYDKRTLHEIDAQLQAKIDAEQGDATVVGPCSHQALEFYQYSLFDMPSA